MNCYDDMERAQSLPWLKWTKDSETTDSERFCSFCSKMLLKIAGHIKAILILEESDIEFRTSKTFFECVTVAFFFIIYCLMLP